MASPRLSGLQNDEQVRSKLNSFHKFLEHFSKTKLYFFSSCSVYGNQPDICNEDSKVIETSKYSKLKIESENLLQNLSSNYTILRLSTLFGYSDVIRNDLLVNNFLHDIKDYDYLEVYDSNSWRPNIHIDDCIEVLYKLLYLDITDNILNIGDNSLNITKRNLIETIQSVLGKTINFKEIDTESTRSYKVDFSKLNSYINYNYQNYPQSIKKMLL